MTCTWPWRWRRRSPGRGCELRGAAPELIFGGFPHCSGVPGQCLGMAEVPSIEQWLGPTSGRRRSGVAYCGQYQPYTPWVSGSRPLCGRPVRHTTPHAVWNGEVWEEWPLTLPPPVVRR